MYKVYQVQSGDTLASVASKLNVSAAELASLNGLMVSAVLVPGQYIICLLYTSDAADEL